MAKTSSVFIGDGSLLVQCAEAWRQAGHAIEAVVSGNGANLDWAAGAGPARRAHGRRVGVAPRRPRVRLPVQRRQPAHAAGRRAGARAQARHQLPRRAAAPLCRPERHLVGADGAGAGARRHLARDDRAGRCRPHRAAGLVRDVARGNRVEPQRQVLRGRARQLHADRAGPRAGRPRAVAAAWRAQLLRPPQAPGGPRHARLHAPANELAALVRALDFGQYANPLGRAKVVAGDDVVLVRSATVPGTGQRRRAGHGAGIEGDTLRVAAIGGELQLGGCTCIQGLPGVRGLRPGMVLAIPVRPPARAWPSGWTPSRAASSTGCRRCTPWRPSNCRIRAARPPPALRCARPSA
jgi:hypothetical protein